MKSFTRVLMLVMSSVGLFSQGQQGDESVAVHVRGGLNVLRHTASIANFEGIADCGTYTDGNGLSPQFSLSLEKKLVGNVSLGVGGRWTTRSVSLGSAPTSLPAFDIATQTPASVVFENTLAARLPYMDIVPELILDLGTGTSSKLRALAGAVIGIPLQPSFELTQRIVSPENAVYKLNRQQSISLSNGEKPIGAMTSPMVAFSLGLENILDAGFGRHFTQSVRVEYTVTDIVSSGSWKALGVRVDLGYRFGFFSAPPVVQEPKAVPPPPPAPAPPVATKTFTEPTPLPILTVRMDSLNLRLQTGNELRASLPLVNAVFFELNSAVIPQRYLTTSEAFIVTESAVEHHRNILLSVARIMKENARASIIVEGATSGNDESQGLNLAKERADNVITALAALGVSRDRMSARTFLTPRIASNADYQEGREENRRVDIIVKDAPLQEYVSRQQFANLRGTIQYSVDAQHFNASEIRVTGNLIPEQVHMRSETRTVDIDRRIPSSEGSTTVTLEANAAPPLTWKTDRDVDLSSLKREVIALDLTSFEAWLRFDYNSSVLSDDNKDLLRQLLRALPGGSTISLLGSADALGDEQSNLELSSKRAAVTEAFVRSVAGDRFTLESSVSKVKVEEVVPEGRFLNRSIRIRVR